MLVFALALLSPLPFISPFDYTVQDAMAQSQFNLPPTGSISNTLPSSFSKFGFTVNPSGAILNGDAGFDSIVNHIKVNTFKIDGFTYAGIHSNGNNYPFAIVNITDINSPNQVSFLDYTTNNLYKITDATYVVMDGLTYAITISEIDDRVSIINVSDPSTPLLVTNITDGTTYTVLDAPSDVTTITIDASTFALVTSYNDDGVQIINITDPNNLSAVSTITDDIDFNMELDGAYSITTTTIGASTFALVAAYFDDGVQIIDVTDPYNPIPASSITKGEDGYTELDGPQSITTTTIGASTFALVTAFWDDGVQIIDITDPYNPILASAITEGENNYTELRGPYSITTTTIGESTFALVAAAADDGVQIVNITDPYNPTPALTLSDNLDGFDTLYYPTSVAITTIDEPIYVVVID